MSEKRTNLQIIEDKRAELTIALASNSTIIQTLAPKQQEEFKKNFLEFASQDYLLSVVEPREIIRFAVNITKIGLDIAPSSNEVYIIPFDTKVNGTKVMLPQAIIPLNGMQQLAYKNGFMLTVDPVYKFNDTECEAARNLTRIQQSKLKTADVSWLNNHFIGYDVVLKDLDGNLGEQIYFVDVSYVKAATKTNKDAKWSLSTWTHKAVRKAYKQFLVPRNRALEEFEKLEHINDAEIIDTEKKFDVSKVSETLKQLGLETIKEDGFLIVKGNTYNKADLLRQMKFVFYNNCWRKEFIEEESSVDIQETIAISTQQKQISPKKELYCYLIKNNIEKDRVGEFVKDVLVTSSEKGFTEALADKDKLNSMIVAFLAEPTTDGIF